MAENLQKLCKFSTAKIELHTVQYVHILHCTLVHNNSILVYEYILLVQEIIMHAYI